MPDERRTDFGVWVGIAGNRKRHAEDQADGFDPKQDLEKLKPDMLVVKDSFRQDLGCPACDKVFQQAVWYIRCGACAVQDYPRLTVFSACRGCGGEGAALTRHAEHCLAAHPRAADVEPTDAES